MKDGFSTSCPICVAGIFGALFREAGITAGDLPQTLAQKSHDDLSPAEAVRYVHDRNLNSAELLSAWAEITVMLRTCERAAAAINTAIKERAQRADADIQERTNYLLVQTTGGPVLDLTDEQPERCDTKHVEGATIDDVLAALLNQDDDEGGTPSDLN